MRFWKKCRPVSFRPLSISSSRKLERKSLRDACAAMVLLPDVEGGLDPQAHHHQPDQRDGDEDLPAQAHDLVVAVARERGPHPQEQIGRASCRERGEISVVAVSLKTKEK